MQGVTEVVPVSSSAHLTLVPWLLGWPLPTPRTTFAAGLHAGSCAGIAVALLADRPPVRTLALAASTCLPAAVAGRLAADTVERRLGRPAQLAGLLAVGGVALAAADQRAQDRTVGHREAALAALAQVAALAPGFSRSGAALTALRAARVGRAEAERFALLMSLPVTAGAAALTLLRADRTALRGLAGPLAAGVPAAALTGWAASRLASRRADQALTRFCLYRLALAVITGVVVRLRATPPQEDS